LNCAADRLPHLRVKRQPPWTRIEAVRILCAQLSFLQPRAAVPDFTIGLMQWEMPAIDGKTWKDMGLRESFAPG
jgi:hypothetical protein